MAAPALRRTRPRRAGVPARLTGAAAAAGKEACGTRTFRTGYFTATVADLRQGGTSWTEDEIYAHTEDYTYRADDIFVGKVNRLFGTRDTASWTLSADYTSAPHRHDDRATAW